MRLFGVDIDPNNAEIIPKKKRTSRPVPVPEPEPEPSNAELDKIPHQVIQGESSKDKEQPSSTKPKIPNDMLNIIHRDSLLPNEILQVIKTLQGGASEEKEEKRPRVMMVKQLSETDITASQSRLLITRGRLKDLNFLNEKDHKILHQDGLEGKHKVPVIVLYLDEEEGNTIQREMKLVKWPLGNYSKSKEKERKDRHEETETTNTDNPSNNKRKSKKRKEREEEDQPRYNYALQKDWNRLVKASKLEGGDVVQVWWFRYGDDDGSRLGLVVLKVNQEYLIQLSTPNS